MQEREDSPQPLAHKAPRRISTAPQPAAEPPAEQAPDQRRKLISMLVGPAAIVLLIVAFWLPQILSNAAATVNGQTITKQQLDRQVAFERVWRQMTSQPVPNPTSAREADRFRSDVLDQMIENTLLQQEAKKAGVSVSGEDVVEAEARFKEQFKLTDQQVDDYFRRANLERSTLPAVLRENLVNDKFVRDVVVKGVSTDQQATTARNWYNGLLAKATIEKKITSGGATVGQIAPDFTLIDLQGKPVKLSDFRGKPVFINFFATWCTPCRQEMPDIEALWKAHQADGVVVLAVNLTSQDTVEAVDAYVKELRLTFPVVLDAQGDVSSLYRVGPIPSSYFIDRTGKLVSVQVGSMSRQTMEQRVSKTL